MYSTTKPFNYLTGECGFSYVLSTFLQNDPIEHHFRLYRQPFLLKLFISSDAKSILVPLVIHIIDYEECEDWAFEFIDYNTDGKIS